jgi:hypothetical protein
MYASVGQFSSRFTPTIEALILCSSITTSVLVIAQSLKRLYYGLFNFRGLI